MQAIILGVEPTAHALHASVPARSRAREGGDAPDG